MQNIFIDEGNLGHTPSLKYVPIKTEIGIEQRAVVELQVRFDVKKNDEGKFEDVAGFWGKVTMWGKRAEYINTHLKKGCRILVVGEISQQHYVFQKGERKGQEATALEIEASHIALVLLGVDAVAFTVKKLHSDKNSMSSNMTENEFTNIPEEA
jgi:single-stranded DNA-binding protein